MLDYKIKVLLVPQTGRRAARPYIKNVNADTPDNAVAKVIQEANSTYPGNTVHVDEVWMKIR